jgi:hypothetical protein
MAGSDLWRGSLFLMLPLCTDEFVWKCSWLFTVKFTNVNMFQMEDVKT